MKILKLEYRNIQSTGNVLQIINFTEGNMWMVIGKNGAGKSSILTAIIYALYGKVEKKTIADISNRLNKSPYTKIYLRSNNKEIIIERGNSPSIFNVWIDGVPYDQAGKNNVKDYLENDIYKMSLTVFTNTLVLSIKSFNSFLSMSAIDKKKIIDKLFGFDVINIMKENLRTEIRNNLKNIERAQDHTLLIKNNIDSILEQIKNFREDESEIKNEKLKELKIEASELLKLRKKDKELQEKVFEKINEINNTINEIYNKSSSYTNELDKIDKHIELINSGKCHTCKREFNQSTDKKILDLLQEKRNNISASIKILKEEYDTVYNKNKLLSEHKQKLDNNLLQVNVKINTITEQIKTINNDNNSELSNLNSLLIENQNKLEKVSKELDVDSKEYKFLEIVESYILGDSGIKSLATKSILPILNNTISELIPKIGDLNFSFEFDDNWNCDIKQFGLDVKPVTLSEGERTKADTVILLAIVKLLKIRHPDLNLLFLDEIFASVDPDSVYTIVRVIDKFRKEFNMNVFIINHVPLPSEMFDMKLSVKKVNNFSEINIESIN